MKDLMRNLYIDRMFVPDLVITSVWAIFAAKSTPELQLWTLAVILMRILLGCQL